MNTSTVTVTTVEAQVQIGNVLNPSSIVIRQVEQGPRGADGSTGDLSYVHDQMTPQAVWVINHNLGKYPSVVVIDSAGQQWEGSIAYPSTYQVTVSFSAGFSGKAYLN